ncbi:YicC/YloC family endoribonuclease [Escherichia coli]|nr:YicC family protein [Escherichia coli]
MIRSMTAYARREIKGEWGSATWEMRSVNQRYLETYFRLPEQFRSLEPVVRERIRSRLTRGKVECTLRYEPDVSAQGELILNEKLAKQLVTAANWVKMQSDEGEINPVDILRWPGVMAAQEQELVLLAQRIDVAEELDRLEAHVKETYNILKKKEAVGRRLDFMMQEFNRESNTLASKSINAEVTNSAIELKVLIEQMREQIQNIE